jgi:hypothetical protein
MNNVCNKDCYQNDEFGVVMGSIYVTRKSKDSYMSNICPYLQPITFHCQRSMYALIMLMRLIHLRIHFSYEVGQRGFVKLSMQSAPCQCKVHNINAKCTMLMQSAKCTTSMMLYKQKQPPLKVRASAMLLFQSIHASMRVKINNDLSVPHVAIDVIKNSTLYKRFVSFGVFYQP